MNLQQAQLLAHKILAGEASQEEIAALKQYVLTHAHLPDLAEHLFPVQELETISDETLPGGIEERILAPLTAITPKPVRNSRIRKLLRISAAAALLTAVSLGAYRLFMAAPSQQRMITLSAATGHSKEITLTDGTHIRLNGGTTLRYPPVFTGDVREVYLDGEAFFEVSDDIQHPFIVHASTLTTTVLGTAFNIRSAGKQSPSEVAVASGKVRVSSDEDTMTVAILTRGEKVIYRPGEASGMHKEETDIVSIGAWKDRRFYYDRAPLSDILLDLERVYGLHFHVQNPAVLSCTYSATFKSLSPEEILQTLTLMGQVKFSNKDSLTEVSGQACH